VRVQEICVGATGGANEVRQESRDENRTPGAAAQIADDPMAVCNPEMTELLRADHRDRDSPGPHTLDRIGDKSSCAVIPIARVRGREDGDLHRVVPMALIARAEG